MRLTKVGSDHRIDTVRRAFVVHQRGQGTTDDRFNGAILTVMLRKADEKDRSMNSRDVKLDAANNVGKRFWEALSESERLDLRQSGVVRSHPAEAALFHEGDLSRSVLIILRGSVKVITNSVAGHERLLAIRGPALSMPSAAFVRVLRRSPAAAMELIRVLGERRRSADHERIEFNSATVAERVVAALIELSVKPSNRQTVDNVISLPLTQDELASMAATSRSGVARALATLRTRKILVTAPRKITILDLAALRACVN